MKSIRFSLVVFFLFLDAVALLTATCLAYYTAEQSLQTEQATHRALIFQQFKDQKQEIEARFDGRLLDKARTLPFHFQWNPTILPRFMPAGLLTSSLAPQGHLLAPVWLASGDRNTPLNWAILSRLTREITVDETQLPHDDDLVGAEYFQINHEWGTVWRSHNLGDLSFPFDPTQLTKSIEWAFDDISVPGRGKYRRVQFKVPIRYFRFGFRSFVPLPTQPTEVPRGSEFSNWIVVHCAFDSQVRDQQLSELTGKLNADMVGRDAESADTLRFLRYKLIAIGVFTFIATVLGGMMLVDIGLSPIRRLSRAVRRVTPKDFRLPIEDNMLPRELKLITQRLRDTLDELRRAFDREKQAVADLSHELRTPVTAILATLDVALRKPRTADEYRQVIVDVRSVGGNMRQLVERLLSLARLDAGVAQLRVEPVEIDDMLSEVSALIRPLAAEKELKLTVESTPHTVWSTDPDKVREILVNLLHNAVQYNKPGGSIHLRTHQVDKRLDITVSDTGIGIAPADIPHIFERFYRADASREEPALHAGLGLSIVRGYVDLLGGTIGATSNLGAGTTFHLSLPELESPGNEREAA
jgi:two-component system, OmpR family, heavy metal sensor histidine kinase CusS